MKSLSTTLVCCLFFAHNVAQATVSCTLNSSFFASREPVYINFKTGDVDNFASFSCNKIENKLKANTIQIKIGQTQRLENRHRESLRLKLIKQSTIALSEQEQEQIEFSKKLLENMPIRHSFYSNALTISGVQCSIGEFEAMFFGEDKSTGDFYSIYYGGKWLDFGYFSKLNCEHKYPTITDVEPLEIN